MTALIAYQRPGTWVSRSTGAKVVTPAREQAVRAVRRSNTWRLAGVATLPAVVVAGAGAAALFAAPDPLSPWASDMVVTINRDQTLAEFSGIDNLGAGIDGLEAGEINIVWTPEKRMRAFQC